MITDPKCGSSQIQLTTQIGRKPIKVSINLNCKPRVQFAACSSFVFMSLLLLMTIFLSVLNDVKLQIKKCKENALLSVLSFPRKKQSIVSE